MPVACRLDPLRGRSSPMTIRGVLAIVAVLSAARQGLGLDITACNTLVADNEVGVLQTDMSCGGAFIAVGLGENSTLDMNGHSITGTFPTGRAVECRGIRCTILSSNGTGRIGGGDFDAVQIGFFTSNVARLRISDVDLHDARGGLHGSGNVLFERDTRVVAQRVAAHGNADFGIWVTRFTGAHIDASHNGVVGVSADKLRGTTITTSSNGASGLFGDRISAKGLISNDN